MVNFRGEKNRKKNIRKEKSENLGIWKINFSWTWERVIRSTHILCLLDFWTVYVFLFSCQSFFPFSSSSCLEKIKMDNNSNFTAEEFLHFFISLFIPQVSRLLRVFPDCRARTSVNHLYPAFPVVHMPVVDIHQVAIKSYLCDLFYES